MDREFLLRWLISWGALLDGMVGVATFGIVRPGLALKAAGVLTQERLKCWRKRKDGNR